MDDDWIPPFQDPLLDSDNPQYMKGIIIHKPTINYQLYSRTSHIFIEQIHKHQILKTIDSSTNRALATNHAATIPKSFFFWSAVAREIYVRSQDSGDGDAGRRWAKAQPKARVPGTCGSRRGET